LARDVESRGEGGIESKKSESSELGECEYRCFRFGIRWSIFEFPFTRCCAVLVEDPKGCFVRLGGGLALEGVAVLLWPSRWVSRALGGARGEVRTVALVVELCQETGEVGSCLVTLLSSSLMRGEARWARPEGEASYAPGMWTSPLPENLAEWRCGEGIEVISGYSGWCLSASSCVVLGRIGVGVRLM
jgi:hypothetical protein